MGNVIESKMSYQPDYGGENESDPELLDVIEIVVDEDSSGIRLDKFLSEKLTDYTRSRIQKLIEDKRVTVNNKEERASYKTTAGDKIVVEIPEPVELNIVPENIPLDIMYEDEHLIVVNKPQGMVVHPAPGNYTGTLVNALMYHCGGSLSSINGVIRPGIVHRIDKDTSGILVVAKSNEAHLGLALQIKDHSMKRLYWAVVHGNINEDMGRIEAPIGRHPTDRKKMAVNLKNGKEAVTHFKVLERFRKYTLVECRLETGRTHQIRVHMSYIGFPVAGDPVYGPKKDPLNLVGQALHARVLGFVHPITGKYMEFESEPPEYFLRLLERLRTNEADGLPM